MNALKYSKYAVSWSKLPAQQWYKMGSFLNPLYGTPLGAKAAAYSAVQYFKRLPPDQVLINLHFNKNGLNTDRNNTTLKSHYSIHA